MTDLEIINAGLCRTGTLSTRKALTEMGFGACYHMQECAARNHHPIWRKCFEEGCFDDIVNVMSDGNFKSGCDLPFCAIFDELMVRYPNAKVILTIRDDPQKWVDSWRRTVCKINNLPWYTEVFQLAPRPLYEMGRSVNRRFHDLLFMPVIRKGNSVSEVKVPENVHTWDMTDEQMCQLYINWIEYVKHKTPPDQLLIFNVKEGIDPLANFLGVDLKPGAKMPFINDQNQFDELVRLLKGGAAIQCTGYLGLSYLIRKRIKVPTARFSHIAIPSLLCILTPMAASIFAAKTITLDKLVPF